MKRVSVPSLPASTRATMRRTRLQVLAASKNSLKRRTLPPLGSALKRAAVLASRPPTWRFQRAGRGEAEDVVDAVRLAPVEDLRAGVMAVGAHQDRHLRPVGADRPHQAAEKGADLDALRPLRRAQDGGDEAAVAIEDDDRLEAVVVVMGVEQAQLLAAVHRIEGVVDVEGDAPRHLAERAAVEVDQGPAQAQQRPRIRQVLQPRDGRLRTQVPTRRQPFERHLEHRIDAQAGGVVAVFVAGRDHQQPEADDVGQRMHGAAGIARIVDAGGQTVGDLEPPLDLAQNQQTAVGGQAAAVEPGDHFFPGNR